MLTGLVRNLSPAYFGFVMATGILSLAANLLALPGVAQTLFRINLAVYTVLWLLTLARIVCYPRLFLRDLMDHQRGPGFFTTVAATSILGSQFEVLAENVRMGLGFWALALTLWVVLTYSIFTALTVKQRKPPLEEGITGSWLLAVVATQSIAVLGALLAPKVDPTSRLALDFFEVSMLMGGGALYVWIMTLILYRYTFFRLSPADLLPSYWINMGAMAISALAGSLLIGNAPQSPFLTPLLPFLKGFTVFYWATGTWWIPLLLLLGVWRHVYCRVPLKYDPLYWSIVFPLGMYAVSTYEMNKVLDLHFLDFLPTIFLYVGMLAWAVALAGFVFELTSGLFRKG